MRRYVINKKPINEFVSTLNAQINTIPELNFQKFLDFFFNLCSRKSSNSITKHVYSFNGYNTLCNVRQLL